jgi:hypothetical protein
MADDTDDTVTFIFEGVKYSLDVSVSSGNAGKLHAHMQPWLDARIEAELEYP